MLGRDEGKRILSERRSCKKKRGRNNEKQFLLFLQLCSSFVCPWSVLIPPGFEPTPWLRPSPNGRPYATGPCDHLRDCLFNLTVLKYFSLPFTPFEPCESLLRKNSLNEYFKAISRYFRVHSLSGFTTAVLSVSNLSRKKFQPLVESGTVVFAARCYLPRKYFAIRQVI